MTDTDRLIKHAAENSSEHTCRLAASDAIRSEDEPNLADAVEDSETGPELLKRAKALARQLRLPLGLKLLWCQHFVEDRRVAYTSTLTARPFWPSGVYHGSGTFGAMGVSPVVTWGSPDTFIDYRELRPRTDNIRDDGHRTDSANESGADSATDE